MKLLRAFLTFILLLSAAILWFGREPLLEALYGKPIPRLDVQVAIIDPLGDELLDGYRLYRDARKERRPEVLGELAWRDDSFLAYRSALTLARNWSLTPEERLGFYLRAKELRIDDALARDANRAFLLETARTAEEAGETETAIGNYREALPSPEAVAALTRLEGDPQRLAGIFLQARLHRDALEALDGLSDPQVEAPAHRALGNYGEALEAYEAWLEADPENPEALSGRAWSNFYLHNDAEADAQFGALPGSNALYGRGLLANRAGDVGAAAGFFEASGEANHLWLATDLLERAGRFSEALPFYLRLGRGDSAWAGQAAFRALVLAERLGDDAVRDVARSLIKPGSFHALVLGEPLELPPPAAGPAGTAAEDTPAAVRLAEALARALDEDAAVGELLFALRAAEDTEEIIALATTLQAYGEYRHSRVAAERLLSISPDDRRLWRLAWPEAFPDAVRSEARTHGVEPEWVWAIMRQESAFYPLAVSTSNARGLMQVVESTWDWLAELQKEEPADVFDVAANIRYGAFYLRWLSDYFDGDLELATASYNRGQGYIRRLLDSPEVDGDRAELYRHIDAQETRNYLERVIVNWHIYSGLSEGVSSVPSRISRAGVHAAH